MPPRWPGTPPRACARCSCAAPAARRATIQNPAMERPEVRGGPGRVCGPRSWPSVGRDHRLRRGRDARLPRLGHARHRGQPAPGRVRERRHRRGRRAGWSRSSAATRPQVLITYDDDQQGYPHPDHLRVHDISVLAFDRAGDPSWYPELGEPWQPLKLYYTVWSRERMLGRPRGAAAPAGRVAVRREVVRAPVAGRAHHDPHRRAATTCGPAPESLRAHATQVDPNEAVLVRPVRRRAGRGLPVGGLDAGRVAASVSPPEGALEDDLFAGVRVPAGS